MIILIFSILTFLFGYLASGVYCLSTALAGRMFGAAVKGAGLGGGPGKRRFRIMATPIEIGPFPWISYVAFVGVSDLESDDVAVEKASEVISGEQQLRTFEELSTVKKIAILLCGPLGVLAVGALLLGLSIWLSAPQLRVTFDEGAGEVIQPSATPGLVIAGQKADAAGQWALVKDTIGVYSWGIVSLDWLKGWGGPIGFLVTSGAAASQDVGTWPTCLALIMITYGSMNLLPFPSLNGGAIFFTIMDAVAGRDDEGQPRFYRFIHLAALPIGLFILGRMVLLDIGWVLSLVGQ